MGKTRAGSMRQPKVVRVLDRFFQGHPEFVTWLDPSRPRPRARDVGRALAEATKEESPCAYSLILQDYLTRIGLTPPKGVFRLESGITTCPGRPRSDDAFTVWVARMKGCTFGQIAKKVFPEEFRINQRRATDRAKQLYRSAEKRHVPDLFRELLSQLPVTKSSRQPEGENPE